MELKNAHYNFPQTKAIKKYDIVKHEMHETSKCLHFIARNQ